MRDLFRCGRLEGIGDRTTDLLEEPSQSGGRDDEVDRRLVCDIAVCVQDIPGYAHVVAGLRIAPLQAAFFLDQHLLRAGEDEENLCVAVAVQRDAGTGRDDTAHHTEFVGPAQKLDRRPEDVQSLSGRCFS